MGFHQISQDGSLYLDYKNIIFYLKKFIDNEIEVLSKNTADFKIIGIEEKIASFN
jgi:hypothetical protein